MSPRTPPTSTYHMRTRRSGGSATSSLSTPPDSDPPPTTDQQPTTSSSSDPANRSPPNPTTRRAARSSPTNHSVRNLTFQQQAAVAKNPALEAKFRRMATLKANFAGVTKALKPALKDLASRTERRLREREREDNDDDDDEPAMEVLKRALERNLEEKKARVKREMELIREMKTREFDQVVAARNMAFERKVEDIRAEMLAHARLGFMSAVYHDREGGPEAGRMGQEEEGENVGQGSNEREDRKRKDVERSVAYFINTRERENEQFYRDTDRMWHDWMDRLDQLGEDAGAEEMREILPRPCEEIEKQEVEEGLLRRKSREEGAKSQGKGGGLDDQGLKQEDELLKPFEASKGNYVKGLRQTKWSKRGEGSVAKGAVEERMRKERLERIKREKLTKPVVAPPPPSSSSVARVRGGRSGKGARGRSGRKGKGRR